MLAKRPYVVALLVCLASPARASASTPPEGAALTPSTAKVNFKIGGVTTANWCISYSNTRRSASGPIDWFSLDGTGESHFVHATAESAIYSSQLRQRHISMPAIAFKTGRF
ncbi:hypothetical protein BJ742DRAFT_832957 [Cladochytrium replicatum]|nr:hypothetical protein BJ742DRAFT_832957 [Cladochytrium replicatum]